MIDKKIGNGFTTFVAETSNSTTKPMQVRVYFNGNVYVTGKATNSQVSKLIEAILEDHKKIDPQPVAFATSF